MAADIGVTLGLFVTDTGGDGFTEYGKLPNKTYLRRIKTSDLVQALDGYSSGSQSDRSRTVCYVCGPPKMTDEFVAFLVQQPGMAGERVLCEKWW